MNSKRTFASVTEILCTCNYLNRAADDPRRMIVFDPETGEYQFRYESADGKGKGFMVIYHCPFCGGAAPESKRALLFAVIPSAEESRLVALLRPVTTIEIALRDLGLPDRDDRSSKTMAPERDGKPPVIEHHRTLVYEHLSDAADVWVTERSDGRAFWRLQGKYIGGTKRQT